MSPAALARSEVPAPPTPARPEQVLGDLLLRAARLGPDDVLLSTPGTGGSWTARQLLDLARLVAGGLLQQWPPGARIATCLGNGPATVLAQLGCALAGMTLVPLNPRASEPELVHALRTTGAVAVLAATEAHGRPVAQVLTALVPQLPGLVVIAVPTGGPGGPGDGLGGLPRAEPVALPVVGPDDLAQVQLTSGTTGLPKGVRITHRAMVDTGHAFAERLGAGAGRVWVDPMPMFHTAGNVLGVVGALWQRAEHVVLPFEAGAVLRAVAEHRASLLSAAPTLLDLLVAHPDLPTTGTAALRVLFTGGMTVTPAFVDRVEGAFGARLSTTFGMTETCGAVLQTSPQDEDDVRRGGVGRPLPGADVRVAGPDGGAVPVGEPGELWVRGPRVTAGYLDDPVATAAAIDDQGWLHTGDLAEMEPSGVVRVVGRLKDMIKTGGENVSPVEVEEVLVAHPGVERAAVVGVPDPRWGELVVAFVVAVEGPAPDPVVLAAHCRERLSAFKVPRTWYVVDELPMTATAKVQRAELRRRAAAAH